MKQIKIKVTFDIKNKSGLENNYKLFKKKNF